MKKEDFLVEIRTEELPQKSLLTLGEGLSQQIKERLQKSNLSFAKTSFFVTPRRLAVIVKDLDFSQPEQIVERKGPALKAAFDAKGKPTQACLGFAKSFGIAPEDLLTLKNEEGAWLLYRKTVQGETVHQLLPGIVQEALSALPIAKRMRWGDHDILFVRPVHSVIMLYGKTIITAKILGCEASRITVGHAFLAPDPLTIEDARDYPHVLEKEGFVMVDFFLRREKIRELSMQAVNQRLQGEAQVFPVSDALLNEVTGLVEWPVPLLGQFAPEFLDLPQEVLISAMQDHQRYFPIVDKTGRLLPYFITLGNIKSEKESRVIQGNERVLRARLADAAFFYAMDQKEDLESRIERLKGIIFQAKLGTLYDKTERLQHLAVFIAKKLGANESHAKRASYLAKTDLTTQMVGEFPELQGVMGHYYALHEGQAKEVALALEEQYLPRFAGDRLPDSKLGQILALADRIDTLVGTFGSNHIPTGDKDPFGLRRAALGVIRILVEKQVNLDLKEIFEFAFSNYEKPLENNNTVQQVLNFIQDRLRVWYQDQEISFDIFASVAALGITNLFDLHKRIKAVQTFKHWTEAEALSIANKRVSNILAKYREPLQAKSVDPKLFEDKAENELAKRLAMKRKLISVLSQSDQYEEVLLQLAELRQPIDDFFDHVMVMTDDPLRRENRILLLKELRQLFLNVADIALLQ